MAGKEAYRLAKFRLDPSNCLATVHQRYRQIGQTDRQDNGMKTDVASMVPLMVPCRCALALGFSPAAGCVAPPPCIYSDLFPGWHVANEIGKPQVCINSNNSSCDCKKTATGNGHFNQKQKLTSTRVVKNYSSTRVLAAALPTSGNVR